MAVAAEQAAKERRSRMAEHDQRAKANRAKYPKPQSFYLSELNRLRSLFFRDHRHISQNRTIFFMSLWFLLPTPLLAAAIAGKVPIAAWIGAALVALLVGAVGNAGGVYSLFARSHNRRLKARQSAMLRALGCGKACEFGCRDGVWAQAQPPERIYKT